ncbi:MAG: hypothetical protein Q9178_002604 [Gyalolechia marmorata]
MSSSTDPDHFFQTNHSLAETERKSLKSKNENGTPIRLPSKILAVIADPQCPNEAVFVAESAGSVRRVAVDTGEKGVAYKGPTAPVTSLAFSPTGKILFAGCWDKTIWSWSLSDRQPLLRYRGHTDFVKCLTTLRLGTTDVIVAGGADASIIVWNMKTAEKLHVLKGHTRGVLDLAVDPITSVHNNLVGGGLQEAVVFSAGSDREIRRWRISLEKAEQLDPDNPLVVHETSVYALRFDNDGDLWTASADGTAKCLSRFHNFQPDSTIQHGDYVRAVALEEIGGYVVTAGRSEDVKVWDRGSGDLIATLDGHYEEVSGLMMLKQRCVSVGIDGTIRLWGLKPEELGNARAQNKMDVKTFEMDDDITGTRQADKDKLGGLTEEEERELDALMQEDG